MSVADERPRRPAAVAVVVGWAVLVAAGLAACGAAVVVQEWQPVRSWEDDFVMRGVLVVTEVLVGVAAVLLVGARALWRNGRAALLRTGFVLIALAGVWGLVDALVERSATSALVASGVLAVAAVPSGLLRRPSVREWRASFPAPPPQPPERTAIGRWDGRLGMPVLRHVLTAGLMPLALLLSALLLVLGLGFVMIDGPGAQWVAWLGAAGAVTSLVLWPTQLQAARRALAAQHGLPPDACRYVLFHDPVVFDATLARALRQARAGHPSDEPARD